GVCFGRCWQHEAAWYAAGRGCLMAVGYPDRDDPIEDLVSIVLAQVRATLQNASIGSAGLRVYGGGWIRIENGGLAVTGTASVTGLLTVDGRLLGTGEMVWSGPWELA